MSRVWLHTKLRKLSRRKQNKAWQKTELQTTSFEISIQFETAKPACCNFKVRPAQKVRERWPKMLSNFSKSQGDGSTLAQQQST